MIQTLNKTSLQINEQNEITHLLSNPTRYLKTSPQLTHSFKITDPPLTMTSLPTPAFDVTRVGAPLVNKDLTKKQNMLTCDVTYSGDHRVFER